MSLEKFQLKIGTNDDGDFGPTTLRKAMEFFKLTPEQAAHFFGQTAHETGGFKAFSENLNYSAAGLERIFKNDLDKDRNKLLSTSEKLKAIQLARKPEAIANFVYANQNGNGNEASGDGWKFRGRGALQTTGRANYKAFSEYIKNPLIMENPDLVSEDLAFESALFFFERNKLWTICNKGVTDESITQLTKRVNGGINGLKDRIELTKKYYSWLTKKNN
jgi:putative chitinase